MSKKSKPTDEPDYVTKAKYEAAIAAIKRLNLTLLKQLQVDLEGLIEHRQEKLTELLMENNQVEEPKISIPRVENHQEEE